VSSPASSLSVAAIDIGRVLADRDGTTFHAKGTCMYPAVRPGDVLRVRSCPAREVAVGEIAVCRTPEYLFGHRVIATGEADGRAYIVTRPDRSREGGDARVFDDDLLGVVVSIVRGGSPVPLRVGVQPAILRGYHSGRVALIETVERAGRRATGLLVGLQHGRAYQRLAGRWFSRASERLRFSVRVPVTPALGEAVFRELEVRDFDREATWHGRPVERWTLTAHLGSARRPAAWATFVRDGERTWRREDCGVRVRYGGTGLDKALSREADRILIGGDRDG
jgi:hypothetical protein